MTTLSDNNLDTRRDEEFLTPVACFHAQQCVEKALKAILERDENEVPKTHDVVRLYGLVQKSNDIQIDFDLLQRVGELYIESRYPGDLGCCRTENQLGKKRKNFTALPKKYMKK